LIVDAEMAGGVQVADGFEVPQHICGKVRSGATGTVHRVPDTDDFLRVVSTDEAFLGRACHAINDRTAE
jgi:hypothetical protein